MSKSPEQMYNFGTGDWVRLVKVAPFNKDSLEKVLLAFNCYPPAIPTIHQALETEGSYDCCLQSHWFRTRYQEVKDQLAAEGIELQVIMLTLDDRRPLNKRKSV